MRQKRHKINAIKHIYKGIEYKSNLEYFYALYLEELKEVGFVKEFSYETLTYDLSGQINVPYKKQLKTKIKDDEEFLMHKCTYTPDFQVEWTKKARNVFYLDRNTPIDCGVKDIPFRLVNNSGSLKSSIEVKPMNESKLDSSKEFPSMQKWVFQKHGDYVQKIKPFDNRGKKCLFEISFTPKKVVDSEVYRVNCAGGKIGDSKIRFKTRTIDEYLKSRGL